MESIFNSIQKLLTPELKSKISSFIGEDDSKVSSAITSIVPGFLGALLKKGDDKNIEGVLKDAGNSDIMSNVLGLLSDTKSEANENIASKFTSSLFGDKLDTIKSAISKDSGISESGISKLTSFISPLLAGFLGNKMQSSNMGLSDLVGKLNSEKSGFLSSIPSSLTGAFGFSSKDLGGKVSDVKSKTSDIIDKSFSSAKEKLENVLDKTSETTEKVENFAEKTVDTAKEKLEDAWDKTSDFVEDMKDKAEYTVKHTEIKKSKSLLWLYLLGILALGILGYYFIKKQFSDGVSRNNITAIETINLSADSLNLGTIAKETVQIALPDGGYISGFKNGTEEQIVNFITSEEFENATEDSLKNKWFNFDNIHFEHGSGTQLTENSYEQVNNMIVILKEFKGTKFKIGAYTDKTGNEEANITLSKERANTIKNIFVKAGLSPNIIDTEGYGSKFAKANESAPDKEREADRKISIRFEK